MSVLVRFEAELRLINEEVPETRALDTLAQAVQDSVGFSGVKVIEVTEFEEQP